MPKLVAFVVWTMILPAAALAASSGVGIEIVSTTSSGTQLAGIHLLEDVSLSGNEILFTSEAPFAVSDSNGTTDLYLKNVSTGSVQLVTMGSDGSQPLGATGGGSMNGDATRVAFFSDSALTAADTNGLRDVYLRDLTAATTQLVSVSSAGERGNGLSDQPMVSRDGSVVAFASSADNLVSGDSNGTTDVYVREVGLGVTERVSVTSTGTEANGFSHPRDLSTSGESVLFYSDATNLAATTSRHFVHDRTSGRTTGIPIPPKGVISGIDLSEDGSIVRIFTADTAALSSGDAFRVYEFDLGSSDLTEVAAFPAPADFFVGLPSNPGPDGFWYGDFSADGLRVAFSSGWIRIPASPTSDQGWRPQLYVHDLTVGETITVTLGPGGQRADGEVTGVGFSADGLVVAFGSAAGNLTPVDTNPVSDVFAVSLPRSPFTDTGASVFRANIIWLEQQGITRGCASDRYCPDDLVTRGQMAAFLSRALNLSDPGSDTFIDDDGSPFESDIERLAAAGITKGCNPDGTLFCPDDPVTRAQMAAFLVRALNLTPATGGDRFRDDDGSIFEDDIETVAATGITKGCNPDGTLFCPDDPVTRAQMAAFLERGLAP